MRLLPKDLRFEHGELSLFLAPGPSNVGTHLHMGVVTKEHCIEESTCDIFGTLRRPLVIRCPGHCAPFPPSLRDYPYVTL